jgi:hypothetical protein
MRKFRTISKPDFVLRIEVMFNDEPSDIAASDHFKIKRIGNISAKEQYTDEQINEYELFINRVLDIIRKYHFPIKIMKQSTRSYAVYIRFNPRDTEGNEMPELIEVMIRIADHKMKNGSEGWIASRPGEIIKSFRIFDEKYPTFESVETAIDQICDDVQHGDFDSLINA